MGRYDARSMDGIVGYILKRLGVITMTIKEFYEWAQKNDCENFNVLIAYCDEHHNLCYDELNSVIFNLDRKAEEIKI